MQIMDKIEKCHKYSDLETAIFLSLSLQPENKLLSGILLFQNNEFYRAIKYLSEVNTCTSKFYQALCYKKLKQYQKGIDCILQIDSSENDFTNDRFMKRFLLDKSDSEFIDALHAELAIQAGKIEVGIKKHRSSFFKNPLFNSVRTLFYENILIQPINDFMSDPVYLFYEDLISLYKFDEKTDKLLIKKYNSDPLMQKAYFISEMAGFKIKYAGDLVGLKLFSSLREKDPFFIHNLEVYSSGLWKLKKADLLGLLAKTLSETHPEFYQTWIVVGNHYSLKGDSEMCIQSLLRSIDIFESPHGYCLLGFESNLKSLYQKSSSYFHSSLKLSRNNDRAHLGLGIYFSAIQRHQEAEMHFKKALKLNPHYSGTKAHLLRFYVRNDDYESGLRCFKEFMGINLDVNEIVKQILDNSGTFTELEELMIIEFVEIIFSFGMKFEAEKILQSVECRTSAYYAKKSLIENGAKN